MKDKTDLGGYFFVVTDYPKRGKGILFKVGKDMTSIFFLIFLFVLSLIYS